jgi:hypothetical protein
LEFDDGRIVLKVDATRTSGSTPARCNRGHMTFVNWSREA